VKPYYADGDVALYLGDCRDVTEWLAADVLVTDPPYGMAYVSGWVEAREVAGDKTSAIRDEALALWGDRPALVFGTWRVARPVATRQVVTWWKRSVGPGMGDLKMPWGSATEEVYVLGDGYAGRRRANLIATDDQRGNPYGLASQLGHPTPKPVGLMEQLIECCPNGVIADPFAGSGATLLAARAQGRRSIGVEIEERYCDLIANRLAQTAIDFGGVA
jgi:hypothetical protein